MASLDVGQPTGDEFEIDDMYLAESGSLFGSSALQVLRLIIQDLLGRYTPLNELGITGGDEHDVLQASGASTDNTIASGLVNIWRIC